MDGVKPLTVELETVTPLFLGGPDPRGEPELRPPAFRGALRYWWRALAGGVLGDDVANQEAQIFGSTDRVSSVRVQVFGRPTTQPFESYRPRGLARFQSSGHDYLYWSMKRLDRKCVPPGQRFRLELRPWPKAPQTALWQAGAALWLLLQLGGLGSRARRTAGSLVARSEPQLPGDIPLPLFQVRAGSGEELARWLADGLRLLRAEICRALGINRPTATDQFDVLHPDYCRIWVLSGRQPWRSWWDAVEGIGAAMRDFRNRRQPDYQNVRDWLSGQPAPPTVERAAFGLPLPFRYNSPPQVSGVVQGTRHHRRASPLHLRVTPLADGTFVGVAVLFRSRFLPKGERLKLTHRGRRPARGTADLPDLQLLEDFIAKRFQCWEVSF